MLDIAVTLSCSGQSYSAVLTFDIFGELEQPLGLSVSDGANELWRVEKADDGFEITVTRQGSGAGLSRAGAGRMASLGYSYAQILSFYFPGCSLQAVSLCDTANLSADPDDTMLLFDTPADVPEAGCYALVNTPRADVRLGLYDAPNDDAQLLTGLRNGCLVTVCAADQSWALVSIGSLTGYVPGNCLTMIGVPPSASDEETTSCDGWALTGDSSAAMLHAAPSQDSLITATVPSGETLTVLLRAGDWALVQYETLSGWAESSTLRFTCTCPYVITSKPAIDADVTLGGRDGSVNMRDGRSTSAQIICSVRAGETVQLLSDDGSWAQIRYGDRTGCMMSSYLHTAVDDTPETEPETETEAAPTAIPAAGYAYVNVASGGLNMRSAPSTGSEVLTVIPQFTLIPVYAADDTWCRTCYEGQYGYVMRAYLLFDVAVPTLDPVPETTPVPAPTEPPEPTTDEDGRDVLYVTADTLPLRAMPYTDADLLATLSRGDRVSLIVDQGDWSFVLYEGMMGYADSDALSAYPPSVNGSTQEDPETYSVTGLFDATLTAVWNMTATVTTDGTPLNVRAWCQTTAPILYTIPTGSTVTVLEKGTTWCKVTYGGVEGYCVRRYLTLN